MAGGDTELPKRWDWVRDRERTAPPMIVIDVFSGRTAEDCVIREEDATVAELNPDYPAKSAVVKTVYPDGVRKLGLKLEEFDAIYAAARRLELQSYAYPAPRLRLVRGGGGQ